jgi:asparagine synthetase B (glutamine-hydrolysing)
MIGMNCAHSLLCRLLALLHPAKTVMDVNIGAALWLAARGTGELHTPCQAPFTSTAEHSYLDNPTTAFKVEPSPLVYTSQARVVLLGHGADEVFGGYGRHRTAFKKGGLHALQTELELDMGRLWLRNLGRDDRIIADCSREARHPFLDEAFLEAVARVPLDMVTDLSQPPGHGDKAMLRAIARRLGLPRAALRVKRAIQFGSRIGKQSNVRDFGSNRAANRQSAGSVSVV